MKNKIDQWMPFGLAAVLGTIIVWLGNPDEIMEHAFRLGMYAAVLSLLVHLRQERPVSRTALLIGLGFVSPFMVRGVFQIIEDSSSNNLWPLSLLILFGLSFFPALAVGWLANKLSSKLRGSQRH